MAKCRSCSAKIDWAITEGGKKIPLDAMASREGNIIKTGNRIDGLDEVHVISRFDEIPEGTARYTTHFSSCPFAKAHRR